MPKINRFNGNLPAFAQNALGLERTIFGSESQSNDLTAQFNADFTRGWGIVSATENPSREDFNAVSFALSQTLAYLHQMGVAEWNATQEYYVNSITTDAGALYVSRNSNVNARPSTSAASWHRITDSGNFSSVFTASFNSVTTAFTRGALGSSNAQEFRSALGLGALATANTVNNGNWSGTDLSVSNGGTGASSLSGLLKGNGTSPVSQAAASDVTSALGFTPARQGGANNVTFTWDGSKLNLQVDASNFQGNWPLQLDTSRIQTGVLPVARGGTGGGTAAAAASSLGVLQAGTASNQIRNNGQLDSRYLASLSSSTSILPGGLVMFHLSTGSMAPDTSTTVNYPFTLSELYSVMVTIRNSTTTDDDIFARKLSEGLSSCRVRAEATSGYSANGTRFIDVLVIGRQ